MISKLPRWVEFGSFILALVAGIVNAVGLLGFQHQSISHLSGTATMLGTGIIGANLFDVVHLALVLLSFVIGSAISGYFLRGGSLILGRNYSGLLMLEAIFLFSAVYFLSADSVQGHYLASAACGLQNALATTYSGAVVRTTHVTGIFTDLGIMLGAKLRGEAFDKRKALLFILIITGFISGGVFGALLFTLFKFNALFVPASICVMLAISYSVYLSQLKR
ncbi:YoaK family protein [Shewanella holmiensis]|jgi:uncharacterized membrane protein YoaK (UPF0700 family)|uniref:DUF1275 domain-containing protein n=1 Tax=Shewanella holmiensis TaxID=2952222 RepID=A0A9X2WIQ3_9GAMM|nr:YoaK family protein [Shewanella holmiensis]MCT7940224.1 DUF1275 domain-containing protein [Shewanella holmiensis]